MSEKQAETAGRAPAQLLANIARPGRLDREAEQLRISIEEYEGHPYLSIRIWTEGRDRVWYPSKRGVSVRPRELADVYEAIGFAARQLDTGERPTR